MPDRVVSSSKLLAIADAIRIRAGIQSALTLDDMPPAILNIPSSGGGSTIDLTGYSGTNWNAAVSHLLDTSGMTDMSFMFYYQLNARSIDVSNFVTSNVTTMSRMFEGCTALQTLNLSSFDTSKVTSMTEMFEECLALSALDLSNWDTSSVTTMYHMFNHSFNGGGKIWAPYTFVATGVTNASYKPFCYEPGGATVHIYTDAQDGNSQGWGTINSTFVVHYGATYQEFKNA